MERLFLGYLEISGVLKQQERDPESDSEETEDAPGLSVLGWLEMETEVWTCSGSGSSAGKAGQTRGKLLMRVSHCLESSVVWESKSCLNSWRSERVQAEEESVMEQVLKLGD